MTPEDFRGLVGAAAESVYLDTPTYGPAPRPTVAALERFLADWSHGRERFERWEGAVEETRSLFAELLHAAVEDVAIIPYVSTALGVLASQLEPGERVVVAEHEFASNLWPWVLQRSRGVEVVVLPAPSGRVDVADYAAAAGQRCAVLAVSAMQSSNGWRAPLAELAGVVHRAGGLLVVDACHGAGVIDLDPARDGIDVLATDSYKWLCGPRGAGYTYLNAAARDRFRPLLATWTAARDPLHTYYGPQVDLSPTASRFDSSHAWMCSVGDRESLRLLLATGIERIERHATALADRFRAGLEERGLDFHRFPEAESSPIVAVRLADPPAAVERLTAAGVKAAARADGVRFGFHVFNAEEDVDAALNVLAG